VPDSYGVGGYSYTPVEFKPLGPAPEAKPDLALATEEAMVRMMRDILVQRGALDVEATPQEANGARAQVPAYTQVPAYKFADAAVGHPWQLCAEECNLVRDAFLGTSGEDIIAAGINVNYGDDGASWVESCHGWASFFDECSATGGVRIDWLPERLETW
jgi:hypothetical protein